MYQKISTSLRSPYQQKMFKVGASVIIVFLVAILVAYCFRKELKRGCLRCFRCCRGTPATSASEDTCNGSSKEKEVNGSGSSEGTDSDKVEEGAIVDEENQVGGSSG